MRRMSNVWIEKQICRSAKPVKEKFMHQFYRMFPKAGIVNQVDSQLNESKNYESNSQTYNPKLAYVFFKSGMIEAWGRKFDKIKEACAKYDRRLLEYNNMDKNYKNGLKRIKKV